MNIGIRRYPTTYAKAFEDQIAAIWCLQPDKWTEPARWAEWRDVMALTQRRWQQAIGGRLDELSVREVRDLPVYLPPTPEDAA